MMPVRPKPAPPKATIQFQGCERKIALHTTMAKARMILTLLSQPGMFFTKNAVLKKAIAEIPRNGEVAPRAKELPPTYSLRSTAIAPRRHV